MALWVIDGVHLHRSCRDALPHSAGGNRVRLFDQLKSRTKGYAPLITMRDGEQSADLVKVDIPIQGEKVDAFS